MKSFVLEHRRASRQSSTASAGKLHAGGSDTDSVGEGLTAVPGASLHNGDACTNYDFASVPHRTANNALSDKISQEEGEIREILIPAQEGKLSAYFGVKLAQIGQDVVVEHLFHDCPAEKAGLQIHDRILRINEEEIHSAAKARMLMDSHKDIFLLAQAPRRA